mgnify:FL=1
MSELSYKELQEQGVLDVPYRAFEYMQRQQAKIDELQTRVDGALKHLDLAYPESWGYCVDQAIDILKGNKDENY